MNATKIQNDYTVTIYISVTGLHAFQLLPPTLIIFRLVFGIDLFKFISVWSLNTNLWKGMNYRQRHSRKNVQENSVLLLKGRQRI